MFDTPASGCSSKSKAKVSHAEVKEVVATLDIHFNQHHIRQNDTAQILIEQPTYSQLYSLSKGEFFYKDKK